MLVCTLVCGAVGIDLLVLSKSVEIWFLYEVSFLQKTAAASQLSKENKDTSVILVAF